MIRTCFLLLISIGLLTACGSEHAQTLNHASVLAQSGNEQVTLADLKQHIVDLPINQRWNSDLDPQQWYAQQIKSILINKLLLAEAKLIGFDQAPGYLKKVRNLQRMAYSSQYLSGFQLPQKPSEEEIKQYYDAHLDEFVFPESRRVFHIYQAHKNNPEKTRQEMQALRNRILQGENIELLAAEYSESESRHKKGMIGTFKKGDLSADFDRVVFSLLSKQPSEVIKTADGYHIFLVSDILPAQSYSLDSVRNLILQRLGGKHALDFIQAKAEALLQPEPFKVPEKEQLQWQMWHVNPRSPLIEVGEYALTLAEFLEELAALKQQFGPMRDPDLAHKMLLEAAYRERIYQHMLSEQIPLMNPETMQQATDQLLIAEYTPVKFRAYVNQNPELLNDYFERNQMRFTTPIMVQLARLEIPFAAGQNLMPMLEAQIKELDAGTLTLDALATKYDGTINTLPLLNTLGLKRIDPMMLRFAFLLTPDEHAPPYRTENKYIILKLLKRTEAKTQPLSVIRDRVMNQFISSNSADLFAQVQKQLLADMQINEAALSQVHQALQK